MNGKIIVVLATLDTKGTEAEYLRQQIEKLNDTALVIDTGVVGIPTIEANITRQQVAQAGGTSLKTLLENPTREVAAPIMANGATHLVTDLVAQGKVNGIIAMGHARYHTSY